jgi:hypothetical protein
MATVVRDRLREDLLRLIEDAGIAPGRLAAEAGLSGSFVRRVLDGRAHPTLETYSRLAVGLGADLSAHIYPNTGPPIRDRHQARIVEALLGEVDPRWHLFTEVVVTRPVHGVIDVVLSEARANQIVAVEIQSELRRVEQLVRWAHEKAAALPSSPTWQRIARGDASQAVSTLLVVRRTRANIEIATSVARQLEVAFPAHPADALRSLHGQGSWPGTALVWVRIEADRVHFMAQR